MSLRHVVTCLLIGAAAAFSAAAAFASPPPSTPASTPVSAPFRCPIVGGILEIPVPPGWESNPRLASDNGVLAFFDPAGLKKGDDIPIWLIVDQNPAAGDKSFDEQLRAILDEGKGHGFTPSDSLLIKTGDGRTVHAYSFNKSGADSLYHGLGVLESPKGTVLLRYQAATRSIWKKEGAAVLSMLKGLSFKSK